MIDQWMREAYGLHQAGQLEGADQGYRRILAAQPDNAEALFLLGEIADQQGRTSDAIELIGKAVAVSPDTVQFRFEFACLLQRAGMIEQAITHFRIVLGIDREYRAAYLFLGAALQVLGRLDEAEVVFRDSLRRKLATSSRGPAADPSPARCRAKVEIRETTLCCIDCVYQDLAAAAIRRCLDQCQFEKALFLTDRELELQGVETRIIEPIRSSEEYSRFVIKDLLRHIDTRYVLLIQYDGFVLNSSRWTDRFQEYDYVGATWPYRDGHDVGNGGFSLRSRRLLEALQDDSIDQFMPEDIMICRKYRAFLEQNYAITFAPREIAERFSFECVPPPAATFGFHGIGHLVLIADLSDEEIERYKPGPLEAR